MKKVLSLVLAVVLTFGMATVAFADVGDGITLGYSTKVANDAYNETGVHLGTVKPGDEERLDIVWTTIGTNSKSDTEWTGPVSGSTQSRVTRVKTKANKVDVRTKVSEGSKAIDSVAMKYETIQGTSYAYVKVEFIDPFVSTKELDFDFTVYLTKKKSKDEESEFQFTGTLENDEQDVDENDDYVNLEDTPVAEALDYIKLIEAELGQGLSIWTKMFKDKKYYGYVSQEIQAEDDEIVTKYPAIDTIYYLQTINLNSSGNYATFDIDDKMYVYNADLEYIGTTADRLPYSTKYYLSTVELDVDDWDGDDVLPDDSDLDNSGTGGDTAPSNANDNPGTGK